MMLSLRIYEGLGDNPNVTKRLIDIDDDLLAEASEILGFPMRLHGAAASGRRSYPHGEARSLAGFPDTVDPR